jgi:transposase-like protein
MKASAFKEWLKGLLNLSRPQRDTLQGCLEPAAACDAVISSLEARGPSCCPRCQGGRWYRWGRQAGLQRFRCRDCGKSFNTLSGTPLARLRHKECWLTYAQALTDGLLIRKAARLCQVHKNTSFRWRHRFLRRLADDRPTRLCGIVEADETFFPLSFKGQRHLPRPAHRRGHATRQRGTGGEKAPVLVLRDRHGATADFKLRKADASSETPIVRERVAPDAVLCSDGSASLRLAARVAGIAHRELNLSAGIRVLAGVYHIQNVNAYDSRLKEWMKRFHGVATKYLENYLGWRRWLERWGEDITPQLGIHAALGREKPFQLLTQT